jgi:hypothetical protein
VSRVWRLSRGVGPPFPSRITAPRGGLAHAVHVQLTCRRPCYTGTWKSIPDKNINYDAFLSFQVGSLWLGAAGSAHCTFDPNLRMLRLCAATTHSQGVPFIKRKVANSSVITHIIDHTGDIVKLEVGR